MEFDSGTDLIDYITENNLLDVSWKAAPDFTNKKVQAWFGDFVFISGDRPEEQIAIAVAGDRRADLHRPDRLRHAADQRELQRQLRRHHVGQDGDHGGVEPLSRLHQPVHDAAAPARRPPLSESA